MQPTIIGIEKPLKTHGAAAAAVTSLRRRAPHYSHSGDEARVTTEEAMRGRALLSRALSPSLPPRGRALPQVLGGSPPSLACVERWISARPCGSGAEMFGAGFLGRARFFSSDAAAATQGGSKPPAPAAAGSAGGEGGDNGQSVWEI